MENNLGHIEKKDKVHHQNNGHGHAEAKKEGHAHGNHGNGNDEKGKHGHGHHGHGHSHGDGEKHKHDRWCCKADVEKANKAFSVGQQLFQANRLVDAMQQFSKAVVYMGFPSQVEIRKDPNCAAQALEQISGATWLILYYRAVTYYKLQNFSDASQDAGRALKLFDKRFKVKKPSEEELNNYASTCWVRGSALMEFGALKEAAKFVGKALEICPGNAIWKENFELINEQVEYNKKLAENDSKRMPVTIITGFLGSGKTTLVNHILTEKHGKKLAVVENEYGAENIDSKLVAAKENQEDRIVEASNGCVCCTVRGDLIESIIKLTTKYKDLDGIIIETTGLADPTPVAQTFYMDPKVNQIARLDGVVTVCDSKHILTNLAEKKQEGATNECKQQLAFADVVLLNKMDLVNADEKKAVIAAVKGINCTAKMIETTRSKVDPSELLGIKAFSLERIMEVQPDFMDDRETKHDEAISSFVVRIKAPIDMELFQDWMQEMLRHQSANLYRSKGLLSVVGTESRFVYHTVHEVMEIEEGSPWKKEEKRESVFVFIGKDLDRKDIEGSMQELIA